MIAENSFKRGDVLGITIPDIPHPQKEIAKLRNIVRSQLVKRVIILAPSTDNLFYCVACKEKQSSKTIPITIGDTPSYAQVHPLFLVDAAILRVLPNAQLANKAQVLLAIEYKQQEYGKQKSKTTSATTSSPSPRTSPPTKKIHDLTLLRNQIRYRSNNVTCPDCRKLIPTGVRSVKVPVYGSISLRIGLCQDCQKYYSFFHELAKENGDLDGIPVYWSNLRYVSGSGNSVKFKTVCPPVQLHHSSSPTGKKAVTTPEKKHLKCKILLNQIPFINTHSKKCPICNHECNNNARIEYRLYDQHGSTTSRYASAHTCAKCDIVFLDKGQVEEIRYYAKDNRVSFFDATKCKNAADLFSVATAEPSFPTITPITTTFPYEFDERIFPNLSHESTVIQVYAKKCHCQKCHDKFGIDPIKNRTAIVNTISGESVKVNVMFCRGCGKYFMNNTSFEEYRKRYGGLLFEFRYAGELAHKKYSDYRFSQDSILSRCGYSVEKSVSMEYRQAILRYILDSGKASKWEIITLLSGFIDLREDRPTLRPACSRWREDIFFVSHYNVDTQEQVYGLVFEQGK